MWFHHKFFKYATGILLTLLIIYVFGRIDFFLQPFKEVFYTISIPIFIAGLLYYILRPLVRLLQKYRAPKTASIIISCIVIILFFALMASYSGSIFAKQFEQFKNDFPRIYQAAQERITYFISDERFGFISTLNLEQKIIGAFEKVTQSLGTIIFGVLSTLTNIGTALLIAPFILFYLLKDDHHFIENVIKIVPKRHKDNSVIIIKGIDTALSSYILGQMIVALAIGILMLIGYLMIGLKYSFLFALFAMITAIIPFFGPWIGILPALLIGITDSPFMMVKILAVMIIVQQIDASLISPQIMGKSLHIHPVTIILLLLAGASLFGFIGLLIALPVYAALKTTIKNIYEMYFVDNMR
ncbi:AI-2E family transporter [Petroclostridium sp. X23]|uniref:AI-2E family transporter n=1 Tax=Petroclostridium sp. X23 TaxID=3045146 RepID=UPI0024AC89DF|nr:AI-2E family transporter [Petroclostridium sp. X23]WHH60875.1 AI-2E family transporter [Petroclostridium sp. X23]